MKEPIKPEVLPSKKKEAIKFTGKFDENGKAVFEIDLTQFEKISKPIDIE